MIRPLPDLFAALFAFCEHADQDTKIAGDVTVAELSVMNTLAAGAYTALPRLEKERDEARMWARSAAGLLEPDDEEDEREWSETEARWTKQEAAEKS